MALYAVIIFGAMVAGQVGGLWWAAYHDAWRIPKRKISSAIDDEETVRFGIRHILIAMFIFSLVFTGDAFFASRFKSHAPLIFFAVFVFGQLVLIVGDRTLTKWGRENRASKIAAKEARTKEARTQLSS